MYLPKYNNSWAVVIGINDYQHASPLSFAVQDAQAVAAILTSQFAFPTDRIRLLLDAQATRQTIERTFLSLAGDKVHPDDRVLIFFAGHGHTRSAKRGEVGYLIPVDGDTSDLATLVRWDTLTRNADLIPAKHILFIMDACYGGLALQRTTVPGSMRFLKDMLQRYARQVLTAGKADETVADSGGPLPGHSIFTGHLLNALGGEAATADGVISANAVMAHVYDRVAKDPHSHQSPHYGFLEGDGDFIFAVPSTTDADDKKDSDLLISIPPTLVTPPETPLPLPDLVKDYLSNPHARIRLDDLVNRELGAGLYATRAELFPLGPSLVDKDTIVDRLNRYEEGIRDLMVVTTLLGRWATSEHHASLARIVTRLAEANEQQAGSVAWLSFRWYPLTLLMYGGGIAALSGDNYAALAALFYARIGSTRTGQQALRAVTATIPGLAEVYEAFKLLPGYERKYTPWSEYLFKAVQAPLENLFFLGTGYEYLFDRFELLYALVYVDLKDPKLEDAWGPPGRFAWKYRSSFGRDPFSLLVAEARESGAKWPPLAQGFFQGSLERFSAVADAFQKRLLNHLQWF